MESLETVLERAAEAAAARHLRDARTAHVMALTTDVLRVWSGRWVLGRPLLAD